jgi:predicted esterase
MLTRTIAATTHGRYIVVPGARPEGAPLLVAYHGYAELAEAALERIQSIPGADHWLLLSIQGLNRFYRGRTRNDKASGVARGAGAPQTERAGAGRGAPATDVVAGWMTSQDRELAIADNIEYVSAVVRSVTTEWRTSATLVFSGFSQGVAMAYRAACASPRPIAAVMALGGDVPPDLDRTHLARIPAALVGRGQRDEWYTNQKCAGDLVRLQAAGVGVTQVTLDAGHEWTPAFSAAAASFLTRLAR